MTSSAPGSSTKLDPQKHWNQLLVHKSSPYMQRLADDEDDDASSSSSEAAPAKVAGKSAAVPVLRKPVSRPNKLEDAPKKDILAEIRERAKMYKTAAKAKADAGRNQMKVNKQSKYISKAAELSDSSSSSSSSDDSSSSESEDEAEPEKAGVIKNTTKTRALKTLGNETKSVNTNYIKSRFEKKDMDSSDDGMSSSGKPKARSVTTPKKSLSTSKPSISKPAEEAAPPSSPKTDPKPSLVKPKTPTPAAEVTTTQATPSSPKAEPKSSFVKPKMTKPLVETAYTKAAPVQASTATPADETPPTTISKPADATSTTSTTTATPAEEEPTSTAPKPVRLYGNKYAKKPVVPEPKPVFVRKFKKPLSTSTMPPLPPKEEKPVAEKIQLRSVPKKETTTTAASTDKDESKIQLRSVPKKEISSPSDDSATPEDETRIQLRSVPKNETSSTSASATDEDESRIPLRADPKKESSITGASTPDQSESSSHDLEVSKTSNRSDSQDSATIPSAPSSNDAPTSVITTSTNSVRKSPPSGGWRKSTVKKEEHSESSFDLDSDSSDDEGHAKKKVANEKADAAQTSISSIATEKTEGAASVAGTNGAQQDEPVATVDVKNSPKTRDLKTLSTETKTVNTNSIKSRFETPKTAVVPPKPVVAPKFQVRRHVEPKSPTPVVRVTPSFVLKPVKRPPIVTSGKEAPDDEKADESEKVSDPVMLVEGSADESKGTNDLTKSNTSSTADNEQIGSKENGEASKEMDDATSTIQVPATSSSERINAKSREELENEKAQPHPFNGLNKTQFIKKPTSSDNVPKRFGSNESSRPMVPSKPISDEEEPFDLKHTEDDDEDPFDLKHSVEVDVPFDTKKAVEEEKPVVMKNPGEDEKPKDTEKQMEEDEPFDAKKPVEEDKAFDLKSAVDEEGHFDSKKPVEEAQAQDTKISEEENEQIDSKQETKEDSPFAASIPNKLEPFEMEKPAMQEHIMERDLRANDEEPLEMDNGAKKEEPFDTDKPAKEVVTVDAEKPSREEEPSDMEKPAKEEEPFDSGKPIEEDNHLQVPGNANASSALENKDSIETKEPFQAEKPVDSEVLIEAKTPVVRGVEAAQLETARSKDDTVPFEVIVTADQPLEAPVDDFEPFDTLAGVDEVLDTLTITRPQSDGPGEKKAEDDPFDLKMTETESNTAEAKTNETEALATHVAATKTVVDESNTSSDHLMSGAPPETGLKLDEKLEPSGVSKGFDTPKANDVVVYSVALNDSPVAQKSAMLSSKPPSTSPTNAFHDSETSMDDMEDESDASSYSDYTESSETGHSSGEGNEPTQENQDGKVTPASDGQLESTATRETTQSRSCLPTINEGDSNMQGVPTKNKSIRTYLETDKKKKRHRRRKMGGGSSNDSSVSVESYTLQMAREFLRRNLAKNNTLQEISIEDLLKELEESEKRQKKLEKQLKQAGVMVAEDIPYEEALQQIERIAKRMKAIGGSDVTHEDKEIQKQLREEYYKLEQDMDKYNNALTMTDEYVKEQEAREKKWEADNEAANLEALIKLRRHMPVNVRHLSEAVLTDEPTPNGKYLPKPMAKKFKRTNVLQLLRLNPDDIFRMHPSTLENLRVVGLTLTERRALYLHLKDVGPKWKAMQADKITNRKWVWYQMMKLNFTENLEQYERHVREYGPPGNHPYATRDNPKGCPMIGKQCPLKADKIMNYDGDYGFTPEAEYEVVGVAKADVDDPGAKAMQEALELAKEKKANERSDILKKHYNGKLLQVSKANGSCELMDEAMDKMEGNLTKWLEDVIAEAHSTVEEYKKEVQSFTEVLGDLKLAVLQLCERSGMQMSGKKDSNNDKKDIRSVVELSLCEEVNEVTDEFFKFIEQRMEEIKVHDGKVLSTIIQLRKLLKELHERNLETLKENKFTRTARSRKLKTRKEIEKEIRKNQKPEEEAAAPAEAQSAGAPGPPAGGRGDLMAALSGRGGRGGGRGDLLGAIAGRGGGRGDLLGAIAGRGGGRGDLLGAIAGRGGRGGGRGDLLGAIAARGRGRGGAEGGGRGDLLSAIAGRGRGGAAEALGGRGDLLSAIAARGRGRGGGRGDLLGAIAARGRGGE